MIHVGLTDHHGCCRESIGGINVVTRHLTIHTALVVESILSTSQTLDLGQIVRVMTTPEKQTPQCGTDDLCLALRHAACMYAKGRKVPASQTRRCVTTKRRQMQVAGTCTASVRLTAKRVTGANLRSRQQSTVRRRSPPTAAVGIGIGGFCPLCMVFGHRACCVPCGFRGLLSEGSCVVAPPWHFPNRMSSVRSQNSRGPDIFKNLPTS